MSIKLTAHRKLKNNKGLTFVELSIALLLLSVIAVSTTLFYSSLYNSKAVSVTEKHLDKVEQALNIYVLENGHLPCPADPVEDIRSSGFGVQYLTTPGNPDSATTF